MGSEELDSMILVGPFLLRVLYESVKPLSPKPSKAGKKLAP